MIIVYITNPSRAEAKKIAKHLLEKRLIACANILPSESFYYWNGKLAQEKEHILLAKTTENNFNNVKNEIKKIHSYKIPCILKIKADANKKYLNWLNGCLS